MLYDCILAELKEIHYESFVEIFADKRVAAVKSSLPGVPSPSASAQNARAAKYSHLTLHELEYPWNSMENLRFSLIKGCPPSKAKHKYMTIVEMLTNHESVSRYGHDLNVVIQLVISKVLFVFNNTKVMGPGLAALASMSDQLGSTHLSNALLPSPSSLVGPSPQHGSSQAGGSAFPFGGDLHTSTDSMDTDQSSVIEIVTLLQQQKNAVARPPVGRISPNVAAKKAGSSVPAAARRKKRALTDTTSSGDESVQSEGKKHLSGDLTDKLAHHPLASPEKRVSPLASSSSHLSNLDSLINAAAEEKPAAAPAVFNASFPPLLRASTEPIGPTTDYFGQLQLITSALFTPPETTSQVAEPAIVKQESAASDITSSSSCASSSSASSSAASTFGDHRPPATPHLTPARVERPLSMGALPRMRTTAEEHTVPQHTEAQHSEHQSGAEAEQDYELLLFLRRENSSGASRENSGKTTTGSAGSQTNHTRDSTNSISSNNNNNNNNNNNACASTSNDSAMSVSTPVVDISSLPYPVIGLTSKTLQSHPW